MLTVVLEHQECVHGSGLFPVWILSWNSRRFFATEDWSYLVKSPETLAEDDDVTVLLDWDRNSQELPELGPPMDEAIAGSLRIHRSADQVFLECGHQPEHRYQLTLGEWTAVIQELRGAP